jgi:hypothetical protein
MWFQAQIHELAKGNEPDLGSARGRRCGGFRAMTAHA